MSCLHELDETVGGIERKLHRSILSEHTFVYKSKKKAAPVLTPGAAL